MVNPKIVDSSEVKRVERKSPATRMIEAVPDGLLTAREVSEHFGVSIETIRRLGRQKLSDGTPKFKAPSKASVTGGLHVWLYTPEDLKELGQYFGSKVPAPRRARKRGTKKA